MLVTAGSVPCAPRRAQRGIREIDAPRRVASATSTASPPSTSTSTRCEKRVAGVSQTLDALEATSRRARVALASAIAAGVFTLSPLAPLAAAPAFAEPAATEATAVTASGNAERPAPPSAASTSEQPKESDEPSPGATVVAVPKSLSADAPLPSELKAQEKAAKAGLSGEGGGEEKPKSKQEKSAGRLKELNDLRLELDLKELEVREKTQELLRQEQTTAVLQEELELAKRLNGILKSELDRAQEEAKLSMGLCAQAGGFP